MASRKKTAKKSASRAGRERSTGSYAHPEASALLRPEAGAQAQFRKKKPPATWRYDPSLSPALDWAGKAERLSFDVPTLPLFVHERLSTSALAPGQVREQRVGASFGNRQRPFPSRRPRAGRGEGRR